MKHRMVVLVSLLFLAIMAFASNLGETTSELSTKQIGSQETPLGNFVADAIRNISGADVALIHATAFRDDAMLINKGPVDEQELRGMLSTPASPIVVLKMKPSLLQKIMERSLGKAPDFNTAFLQVSGVGVVFDSNKPAAARIELMKIHGRTLTDDTRLLSVAMPRELGLGGAGYIRFIPEDVINGMTTTEYTITDALKSEFSRNGGKISPIVDGRLTDRAHR